MKIGYPCGVMIISEGLSGWTDYTRASSKENKNLENKAPANIYAVFSPLYVNSLAFKTKANPV
jgi:hypothetical protein